MTHEQIKALPPFCFDRYINGVLMAEGVCVEKQDTLEAAITVAARIAPRGPNGEAPVLVYRAAHTALEQMDRADMAEADYARLAACSVRELSESGRKRGEAEAKRAAALAEVERLRGALLDMLSGWQYIRKTHGDLYGVGWDRCEDKARAVLQEQGK